MLIKFEYTNDDGAPVTTVVEGVMDVRVYQKESGHNVLHFLTPYHERHYEITGPAFLMNDTGETIDTLSPLGWAKNTSK